MLTLPVRLTHDDASACCRMLVQTLRTQSGTQAAVDASALNQFDSSALAVLLEVRREALTGGKTFSVRGLPARLAELAGLYGVSELLPASAAR